MKRSSALIIIATYLAVAMPSALGAADNVLSQLGGWWDEGVEHDSGDD